MSHGIGGRPGVAARHAERLAASGRYGLVRAACLRGEPLLEDVLDTLAGRRVEIAPLLIADGHTMASLRRRTAAYPGVRLRLPVGEHPGIAPLILEKAETLCACEGWAPGDTTLLLVGHGSVRHRGSGQAVRRHVMACIAGGRFAEVIYGFLDEAPRLAELIGQLTARPCIAIGLFMDDGPHGRDDVLAAFRSAVGPIAYAGALGADERIAALSVDGAALTERGAA